MFSIPLLLYVLCVLGCVCVCVMYAYICRMHMTMDSRDGAKCLALSLSALFLLDRLSLNLKFRVAGELLDLPASTSQYSG